MVEPFTWHRLGLFSQKSLVQEEEDYLKIYLEEKMVKQPYKILDVTGCSASASKALQTQTGEAVKPGVEPNRILTINYFDLFRLELKIDAPSGQLTYP